MKYACQDTHGLLSAGRCPWCDCPIVDGQPKPDLSPRESAFRRWNVSALMRALDHEKGDVRIMAVSNLLLHGPKVEEALPVLRKALKNSQKDIRRLAVDALYRIGGELPLDEVEKLEQEVVSHPDDCALHLLLLGYYPLPALRYESARKARQSHVLWVIENAPEVISSMGPLIYLDPTSDGEVYELAKKLWLKQVE